MANLGVIAEEDTETEMGAELAILPDLTQIPQITPNVKNTIPLVYDDNFGMNWTQLQNIYGSEGIGKLLSFFTTRVLWPIIHPTWRPLLGYTRVVFDAEIIGNPSGWSASITPTTVAKSTDGTTADLNLEVFVNDLAADNTVTVRIAATRFSKVGEKLGTSYFEIPLRSENLEYFDVKPLEQFRTVSPDSIVYYQIEVTNLGYYVDTFAADITSDNETKAILTEQSMVLNPGETRIVTLQIMTPDNIFDVGTIHTINITGYSVENPEFKTYAQVQVKTQGFYFSPLLGFALVIILILGGILFVVYRFIYEKRERELFGKPTKPWLIPEEKTYLEKLKKEKPEKYDEVFNMMKNEYQSALDWYHNFRAYQRRKGEKEDETVFGKIKNVFPFSFKEKISETKDQKKTDAKQKNKPGKIKKKKDEQVTEKPEKKPKTEESDDKRSNKFVSGLKKWFSTPAEEKLKSTDIQEKPEEPKKETSDKTDETAKKDSVQDEESKPISEKIVSVLKKWFTVPEEEKQKESSKKMHATESVEKKPKQKTEKQSQKPSEQKQEESKTDYEQELDRIEKEQKLLRAQKEKQREQSQKQKAIEKIKKDEKKQKRKWSL